MENQKVNKEIHKDILAQEANRMYEFLRHFIRICPRCNGVGAYLIYDEIKNDNIYERCEVCKETRVIVHHIETGQRHDWDNLKYEN